VERRGPMKGAASRATRMVIGGGRVVAESQHVVLVGAEVKDRSEHSGGAVVPEKGG
jgi:hypothetical protein